MRKEEAIKELSDAINYIQVEYSCDDRDLKCPNPDSLAIALKELNTPSPLDELVDFTNNYSLKCPVAHFMSALKTKIKQLKERE